VRRGRRGGGEEEGEEGGEESGRGARIKGEDVVMEGRSGDAEVTVATVRRPVQYEERG